MRNLIVFLFVFNLYPALGQEINCSVEIIAPKLQSNPANKEILTSLKTSVYEFINNNLSNKKTFDDMDSFFFGGK